MTTTTLTMAGHLALAGAARVESGSLVLAAQPAVCAAAATTPHGAYGHLVSSWTKGAIAKPATSPVFDRKNRPTRPRSELSP